MELALVVYLVNLLDSIDTFFASMAAVLVFVAVLGGFIFTLHQQPNSDDEWAEHRNILYKYVLWPKTFIVLLFSTIIIPTEKTMHYIAAAYLIQTTYESEFVQTAGTLAGKAVINQLATWAEGNDEVGYLLKQLEEQGVKVEVKKETEEKSK